MKAPVTAVIVGVVPPPYSGEAVMTAALVGHAYEGVRLVFVNRMLAGSARDMERMTIGKVARLGALVARLAWTRLRCRAGILYYSPTGPDRAPMLRDLAVLLTVRWMFRRTIFHFHAAGMSSLYEQLPKPLRPLFRAAYFNADMGIRPAASTVDDPQRLRARRAMVVPYGVADVVGEVPGRATAGVPTVLFVGALRESKGVALLLEAAARLRDAGQPFRLELMGAYMSAGFEAQCQRLVQDRGLADHVCLLGELAGETKLRHFASASILCLPSHYESESAPVVIVEAMQAGLPVVATRWRGIADLVDDGRSGVLVPPRDPGALFTALATLLADPRKAEAMGREGRRRYLQGHTMEAYHAGIQAAFDVVRSAG